MYSENCKSTNLQKVTFLYNAKTYAETTQPIQLMQWIQKVQIQKIKEDIHALYLVDYMSTKQAILYVKLENNWKLMSKSSSAQD